MTLVTTHCRVSYTGNGATDTFPYTFPIFRDEDLRVTREDTEGNEKTLVLGVDYAVSGAGTPSGGNVTLLDGPLPEGYRLVIRRLLPMTQETDFRNQGAFRAEVHEQEFDRVVAQMQQINEVVGDGVADARVLRLGETDEDGEGAYRAKGNRIADLGDPEQAQDGVNLRTLEQYVTSVVEGGTTVTPTRWQHTGDGATTRFSLPGAPVSSSYAYLVTLDGVLQEPEDDYSLDLAKEEIVFSEAPADGVKIDVRSLGYGRGLPVPPTYKTSERPAPGPEWHGKFILVHDPDQAELLQMCMITSTGSYAWTTVAVGGY